MRVSETFFSIQGEGPYQGHPSFFLRLGGCNLMCSSSNWKCDTLEVFQKFKNLNDQDVLQQIAPFQKNLKEGANLVITGGEPLLQEADILEFLFTLVRELKVFPHIEIETNGTLTPNFLSLLDNIYFNVSPKLENSGIILQKRYISTALGFFSKHERSIFKFVITREEDWKEIEEGYISRFDIPKNKIWLMPGASNQEELAKNSQLVANLAIQNNVGFSNRLQVQIWNRTIGI